jgi:hypothetical protein
MDNPDKLATLGTQDTRHKTQDEYKTKQNKTNKNKQHNVCWTPRMRKQKQIK